MNTPVLLLVFNRPSNTLRVFNTLRDIQAQSLYIACDGPRRHKPADSDLVEQVRSVVKNIDWPCEVQYLFRDENLGCKDAVASAIDWFFCHVDEGIILEDDTLPVPEFYYYCQSALAYYRNNPKVGAISGHSIIPRSSSIDTQDVVGFVGYALLWGWATWRRVWQEYDKNMSTWNAASTQFLTALPYSSPRFVYSWSNTFTLTKDNQIDTWDYQYYYLLFLKNLLIAVPPYTLIENIGYGTDATHTQSPPPSWLIKPSPQIQANVRFIEPEIDLKLTKQFLKRIFGISRWHDFTCIIKQTLMRMAHAKKSPSENKS